MKLQIPDVEPLLARIGVLSADINTLETRQKCVDITAETPTRKDFNFIEIPTI